MRKHPARYSIWLGIPLGMALALMPGWTCAPSRLDAPPVVENPADRPNTLGKWDEDIDQAQADALNAKTPLAKLQAEKREADARAHRAEDESRQWHQLSTQKDSQIKAEQDRLKQVYLYWAAGIFLLLAVAAAVVAVWQPIVRKLAGGFAIACVAGASLCVFFAWLVPYLIWVGGGMAVIAIGAALIWWKRDTKGLNQVVEAVGTAKEKVPAFAEAYKGIFNGVIDTDAENHITNVRSLVAARLAKEKTRLADAVHKLAVKV